MRIVIETDDKTTAVPATAAPFQGQPDFQGQPEEHPQGAQDAGPGPFAGSGRAGGTAPAGTGHDSSDAVDAGAPPEWLVEEIARLRSKEDTGSHTQDNLEDAGPAAENAGTGKINARSAAADDAGKGKKSS